MISLHLLTGSGGTARPCRAKHSSVWTQARVRWAEPTLLFDFVFGVDDVVLRRAGLAAGLRAYAAKTTGTASAAEATARRATGAGSAGAGLLGGLLVDDLADHLGVLHQLLVG